MKWKKVFIKWSWWHTMVSFVLFWLVIAWTYLFIFSKGSWRELQVLINTSTQHLLIRIFRYVLPHLSLCMFILCLTIFHTNLNVYLVFLHFLWHLNNPKTMCPRNKRKIEPNLCTLGQSISVDHQISGTVCSFHVPVSGLNTQTCLRRLFYPASRYF